MRARLFVLTLAALALAGWIGADRYAFHEGSRVWVTGTSTIHDWECEAEEVAGALAAESSERGLSALGDLTVVVPVQAIECGNGTMNSKLRDAFDARANPTVRFDLASADVEAAPGGAFTVSATGRLTMAGQSKTIRLQAEGHALADGRYRFTGRVPLAMTAFGMKPPTAMLGTLKTGDDVVAHFDVVVGS